MTAGGEYPPATAGRFAEIMRQIREQKEKDRKAQEEEEAQEEEPWETRRNEAAAGVAFTAETGEEGGAMSVENIYACNTIRPGEVIMDCGATQSVSGTKSMEELCQQEEVSHTVMASKTVFRFGQGSRANALSTVRVQLPWGSSYVTEIVPTETPPLLGINAMKALGAVVDFETGEIYCRKTNTIKMLRQGGGGHLLGDLLKMGLGRDLSEEEKPRSILCKIST